MNLGLATEICEKLMTLLGRVKSAKDDTLTVLYQTRDELNKVVFDCKISNTVGNSASIIGTGLLFTPLFFIGLGVIAAGTLTSLGTNITENIIIKNLFNKVREAIEREEKECEELLKLIEEH